MLSALLAMLPMLRERKVISHMLLLKILCYCTKGLHTALFCYICYILFITICYIFS